MSDFAKLFKVSDKQVLVYKDIDNDSDEYLLVIKMDSQKFNAIVSISPKYKSFESRESAFEDFDEAKAQDFLEFLAKMEDEQEIEK